MGVPGLIFVSLGVVDVKKFENNWLKQLDQTGNFRRQYCKAPAVCSLHTTSAYMKKSPWMEGVKGGKGEPTPILHDIETAAPTCTSRSLFSGVFKEYQIWNRDTVSVLYVRHNTVLTSPRLLCWQRIRLTSAKNSSIKRLGTLDTPIIKLSQDCLLHF